MKIKKAHLIKILCFSLCCNFSFAKSFKHRSQVSSYVRSINKKKMEAYLRDFLAASRPSRLVGTSGHQGAIDHLLKTIKSIDEKGSGVLTVEKFTPNIAAAQKMYQDDFKREIVGKFPPQDPNYKKWDRFTKGMVSLLNEYKNVEGKNIVWEKAGSESPNEWIIIGAHFDSINFNAKTLLVDKKAAAPGANDNASGVSQALALIELISQVDIKKGIRIIFFDYQELGFLGSKAYVSENLKEIQENKVKGFINLEMTGRDTRVFDTEGKFGNMKAYLRSPKVPGHQQDLQLFDHILGEGKKLIGTTLFKTQANGLNAGDQVSFWEVGVPALMLSQNWESDHREENYHSVNDFAETLNFSTLKSGLHHLAAGLLLYLCAL